MVSRWVAALIVAASMAFAPVALDACQSTCASHDASEHDSAQAHAGHHSMSKAVEHSADDHAAHAEHSCHHVDVVTPGPEAPGIAGVPHTCGHTDEIPPTSVASDHVLLHAPAVVPILSNLVPHITSTRVSPTTVDVPEAVPLLLSLPLRV